MKYFQTRGKTVYKPVTKLKEIYLPEIRNQFTQKPTKLDKQQIKQIRKRQLIFSSRVRRGTNYGVFGLELQYRLRGKMRLEYMEVAGLFYHWRCLHFLYSVVDKLYLWDYLYSDLQFGALCYGKIEICTVPLLNIV